MVEQPGNHGGHRRPAIDPVALHQRQHIGRVETPAGHDQGVANDQRTQQGLHLPHMKKWPRDQCCLMRRHVDLVRKLASDLQGHVQAREHSPVRQHDCLRLARSAGGEDDHCGPLFVLRLPRLGTSTDRRVLAAVDGPGAATVTRRHLRCRRRIGQCQDRIECSKSAGQLDLAPPGIGKHGHRSCTQAGPKIHDPFGTVPAEDKNAIAGLDAELQQLGLLVAHRLAQFLEAEDTFVLDDVGAPPPNVGIFQHAAEVTRAIRVHPVGNALDHLHRDLVAPAGSLQGLQ